MWIRNAPLLKWNKKFKKNKSNLIICQQKPPVFSIFRTFSPIQLFLFKLHFKTKIFEKPLKRFRTPSLYRAKWNYIYFKLSISFITILTNTVKTHDLHHLAVEFQLHDIHVDGGEDGDYGTVLYLKFHPEKYFGFKCFFKITLKFSSLVFLQYFIPEWNLVMFDSLCNQIKTNPPKSRCTTCTQ